MRTTAHLLLFTFALSSCVTIYQPSTVVTPLPEKKGDMEVQATFRKAAIVSRGATLNASYAYALSGKYAAMVNLEYTNEAYKPNDEVSFNFDTFKDRSGEIYFGRYHATNCRHTAFYLGVGGGTQDLRYRAQWQADDPGRFASDYLLGSVLFQHTQRKAHRYGKERVLLTFFTRLNYVYNYNKTVEASDNGPFTGLLRATTNFWNLEPGLNLSLRLGKFDVMFQGLFSLDLNDYANIETTDFYNTTCSFSIGTRLNLNDRVRAEE